MITKQICKGVRYKYKDNFYEVVEPWVKVKIETAGNTHWCDGVMYRLVGEAGGVVGEPFVRDRRSFQTKFDEV